MDRKIVRRGQVWMANIPYSTKEDSKIQRGRRPVVIVSNELNNKYSPVLTVVTLTSRVKKKMPTHVNIGTESGLKEESIALCEQIMTIDLDDLIFEIGECTEDKMKEINTALKIQAQLIEPFDYNYIEEVLFMIKEAESKYYKYQDSFFAMSMQSSVRELKRYCEEYCRDYKHYLINLNLSVVKNLVAM